MENFKDANKFFFIGIGGIGMSGLARLLQAKGKEVSGSDSSHSSTIDELEEEGFGISIGHAAHHLDEDTECVIYSEAIPETNRELQKARELEIPTLTYFEALGEVSKDYHVVAVAGSHGKTTTTAMLALILEAAGKDPTVIVGSKLKEFGNKNVRVGESDLFVVEACEYRRNFMSLKPDLLGITNIELDHLDYFKDQNDYENAFNQIAAQSKEVLWPEDTSEFEGEVGVPGDHNLRNAGLAAAMARRLGASEFDIAEALAAYQGAWRRFEFKGTSLYGAKIYDDYAHHPSEIQATLAGAREKFPEERIVAVFQPHQYSRTRALFDEFVGSFEDADEVIIPNIYAARDTEEDKRSTPAEELAEAIAEIHDNAHCEAGLENTASYLEDSLEEGDVLIVMGAGDVNSIIPKLLS